MDLECIMLTEVTQSQEKKLPQMQHLASVSESECTHGYNVLRGKRTSKAK